jgi:hypothetical protein
VGAEGLLPTWACAVGGAGPRGGPARRRRGDGAGGARVLRARVRGRADVQGPGGRRLRPQEAAVLGVRAQRAPGGEPGRGAGAGFGVGGGGGTPSGLAGQLPGAPCPGRAMQAGRQQRAGPCLPPGRSRGGGRALLPCSPTCAGPAARAGRARAARAALRAGWGAHRAASGRALAPAQAARSSRRRALAAAGRARRA